MKTVVTVVGIRPDFIRMAEVFRRLDESPNIYHILIHTGQHYDNLLSDVFFKELCIREPDYNLGCGESCDEHFELCGSITKSLIYTLRYHQIKPDLVLFLGDSNSVLCSADLKKEGYTVGHIEAGMRSRDRRMLEEINRIVCDHCSDWHFVYHTDYAQNLLDEGIPRDGIRIVGNTIVEVVSPLVEELQQTAKTKDFILADIHRPENFQYPNRLKAILDYLRFVSITYQVPVKLVGFPRTLRHIEALGNLVGKEWEEYVTIVPLMSFKEFVHAQYNSLFMVSDSGTAQEEPALLNTPVIVPREFTERPQSCRNHCSFMLDVHDTRTWADASTWIRRHEIGSLEMDVDWLGEGRTSLDIVTTIEENV